MVVVVAGSVALLAPAAVQARVVRAVTILPPGQSGVVGHPHVFDQLPLFQRLEYKGPVFFGDTIRLRLTVESATPSSKGGKGVVVFRSDVLKQDDTVAVAGTWTVLFRDRGDAVASSR